MRRQVRILHRLLELKVGRAFVESALAHEGNQKPKMGDLVERGGGGR